MAATRRNKLTAVSSVFIMWIELYNIGKDMRRTENKQQQPMEVEMEVKSSCGCYWRRLVRGAAILWRHRPKLIHQMELNCFVNYGGFFFLSLSRLLSVGPQIDLRSKHSIWMRGMDSFIAFGCDFDEVSFNSVQLKRSLWMQWQRITTDCYRIWHEFSEPSGDVSNEEEAREERVTIKGRL